MRSPVAGPLPRPTHAIHPNRQIHPIQTPQTPQTPKDRAAAGRNSSRSAHRPLQLELFGPSGERGARPGPALRPSFSPGAGRLPSRPLERRGPHRSPRSFELARPAGERDPSSCETGRAELFRRLSRLTRGRLRSLALTDNRRTILSVRPGERGGNGTPLDLRIHRSFVQAPTEVLQAVAAFLDSKKGTASARQALAVIREHFTRVRHASPGGAQRRPPLQPVGTVLDLREVVRELNERCFEGRLKVRVTWGRATGETAHHCRRSRTSSLELGSYSYEDRLIRLHRVLDRPEVPRYVIESVVFHELLHAAISPVVRNGRRYFHTAEFRRRERQFRHFERADRWVRENLQSLLRARRGAAKRARNA